jgi:hypothetical protein
MTGTSSDDSATSQPAHSVPASDAAAHECEVLRLLAAAYEPELRRRAKQPSAKIESVLIAASGLGRNTIVPRLHGMATHKLQANTAKKLDDVFRAIDANLPDNCVGASISEIKHCIAVYKDRQTKSKPGDQDDIRFNVPGYADAVVAIRSTIVGTYVTYRYAFEPHSEALIAREVLDIFQDGPDIGFSMSFCKNVEQPDPNPGEFRGKVIPVGLSLYFIGFSHMDAHYSRGRSFFIPEERGTFQKDCNIGILSGTRLYGDHGPSTACALMFRAPIQRGPTALRQFVRDVTRNKPFEKIMPKDFGNDTARQKWLKTFLDNRPAGSANDPDLAKFELIDGEQERPRDFALRVDLERFRRQMRSIYEEIKTDTSVNSPFKPSWSRSRSSPRQRHKSKN